MSPRPDPTSPDPDPAGARRAAAAERQARRRQRRKLGQRLVLVPVDHLLISDLLAAGFLEPTDLADDVAIGRAIGRRLSEM